MFCSPGEKLPPFPLPTHGSKRGLLALPTIASAIDDIPTCATDHDIDGAYRFDKPALDRYGLSNTITCGGGSRAYHYSGERAYTIRELACLQTFPVGFQFAGWGLGQKRMQIGNAVPPKFAETLFVWLRKWLEAEDRAEMAAFGVSA